MRHFDKQDGLIDSAAAIARSGSPASERISARSRKSCEYGSVIGRASLSEDLESH
jgi:hypothetical protein